MVQRPQRSTPTQRVEPRSATVATDADSVHGAFVEKLHFQQAKFEEVATRNDHYLALAHVVRDRLLSRWVEAARTFLERESRTVAYLSAEYLVGPQLRKNLLYLGMTESALQALAREQIPLEGLLDHEEEPGLGNGGLGRLAACYMDSLATLEIPAIGYGIRYEHGIFDQAIRDGQQVELTDKWLRLGYPWELARPEILHPVGFGGRTHHYVDDRGHDRVRWEPERIVRGMAYDTPLLGYATQNANFLRLWTAVATEAFDFQAFNSGDYHRAVEEKFRSENVTKVLYPNDSAPQGRQLRLEQQYLLVSCSLQDMLRLCLQRTVNVATFDEKFAVQLNDTHPALAVAELMRLLVDVHAIPWDRAWEISVASFGYTNHTLLPEALETWGLPLFGGLLPRHLEIIYEINHRFLSQVRARYPGDDDRVRRMSLIDEGGERAVRMAHLAAVGSHAINGVAAMHSTLLRDTVLRDFAELYPERFFNVTNGVTPRRFIALANPGLSRLITSAIGERWLSDLEQLRRLEALAEDSGFRAEFQRVKQANKAELARYARSTSEVELDPDTMFAMQIKRMHEYKRQLLNVLHVVTLYQRIRAGMAPPSLRRTFVFAGKAAPGYAMAKLVIRLIHDVGRVIQREPRARQWLNVAFIPDFNVKVAEHIYPAADLSEQISTAGKEASGTGNMKLSLNGALTIGTLDGANVEIREHVGAENFYLFGLRAEEVRARKEHGYRPSEIADGDGELREVLQLVRSGHFSNGDDRHAPLIESLLAHDEYMVLADYRAYVEAETRAGDDYRDRDAWTRRAVQTVARMGHFSSDRSIREYCQNIWHVTPMPIHPAAEAAPGAEDAR